jgi:hypothetical protein
MKCLVAMDFLAVKKIECCNTLYVSTSIVSFLFEGNVVPFVCRHLLLDDGRILLFIMVLWKIGKID